MKHPYAHDIKTAALSVAWDAEVAKAQAPARISYANLASITDLANFVRLFEDCLQFDNTGLTMQRRS